MCKCKIGNKLSNQPQNMHYAKDPNLTYYDSALSNANTTCSLFGHPYKMQYASSMPHKQVVNKYLQKSQEK